MGKYGIYDNHTDFYNNLLKNHRIKYNISETESVLGTVSELYALGVKAIVMIGDDKKKYIIFPRSSNKLEIE
jgi:hypothetical protein|tara:strand:+ start:291 stop:506 length:216 start_codon:yes stop_codon:yes gene_type:complete